jgi:hypothetical protein
LRPFAAKILLELRDFFLQWYGFHGWAVDLGRNVAGKKGGQDEQDLQDKPPARPLLSSPSSILFILFILSQFHFIREIREIRGKFLARLRDSTLLHCIRSYGSVTYAPFRGYSLASTCSPCH